MVYSEDEAECGIWSSTPPHGKVEMLKHLWRSLIAVRRTPCLPRVYSKNYGTARTSLHRPYVVDVPTVRGIKIQTYGTYAFTDDEGRIR